MKDSFVNDVQAEVVRRGITRVLHFTQVRKLVHVFGDVGGIASTSLLKRSYPDILDSTDERRLDNHPDHISCSIEYPNVWYLQKARQVDPIFKDWVILVIKPDVLWRDKSLFSPVNSATECGRFLEGGIQGFQKLFLDRSPGRGYERTPKTPPSIPTDGQAEAMIYNFIENDVIMGGVFSTEEQAKLTTYRLKDCGIDRGLLGSMKWTISHELFSTEFRIRKELLVHGVMPVEDTYEAFHG